MPMPEVSSTRVLAIRGGSNASNKNDAVLKKIDDSDLQFWEFVDVTLTTYTMEHYYDMGYEVRMKTDLGLTSISSFISYNQNVVATAFKEIFPSLTVTNSTIEHYRSYADDCKGTVSTSTVASLSDPCSHSPFDHLTRNKIRTAFFKYGSGKKSVYFWIGHILPDPGQNRSESMIGINNVMMMMGWFYNKTTGNTKPFGDVVKYSQFVLFHETVHQLTDLLDQLDHYCEGDFGKDGKCSNKNCYYCNNKPKPICLMNSDYNSYNSIATDPVSSLLCDKCKNNIGKHLKNH